MRRSAFVLFLLLLTLLAGALRIWELETRLLHSDEGVNYHFIVDVIESGIYSYSHQNYHGPLYFYLSAALMSLLGDSVAALRSAAALCGILLVFTPFLYRPFLSNRFALLAGALLAVSPSQVFYSRYAIHESSFVLLTAVLGAMVFRLMQRIRLTELYFTALVLALLVATKETFIIACFSIALGLVFALPKLPARVKRVDTQFLIHLAGSALLAISLVIFIFSAGLRFPEGLSELLKTVPQWVARSASGEHSKPAGYYLLELIAPIEPYLFLGPLLWGVIAWGNLTNADKASGDTQRAGNYFLGWSLGSVLVYSAISYKTPWLVINLTLPAALLLALCIERLRSTGMLQYRLSAAAVCACLVVGLYQTLRLNYQQLPLHRAPLSSTENPFMYVHTGEELLSLVSAIEEYRSKVPSAHILVATDEYWPLPFYLRDMREHIHYVHAETLTPYQKEYSVIIGEPHHRLATEKWEKEDFELRIFKKVALFTKRESPCPNCL